jgi:hypothetical protein
VSPSEDTRKWIVGAFAASQRMHTGGSKHHDDREDAQEMNQLVYVVGHCGRVRSLYESIAARRARPILDVSPLFVHIWMQRERRVSKGDVAMGGDLGTSDLCFKRNTDEGRTGLALHIIFLAPR